MLMHANKEEVVSKNKQEITKLAGYFAMGGGITYAMEALERNNYISQIGDNLWKVHV